MPAQEEAPEPVKPAEGGHDELANNGDVVLVSPPEPPSVDDDDANWKEKLLDQLRAAIQNAVTLEITTAVGPVGVDDKGRPSSNLSRCRVATTRINMLLGDITTVYEDDFVTGDLQALRDFHLEREKDGYQIVKDNLEAIGNLINRVVSWQDRG